MVALQTLCLLAALAGGGDMVLLEFHSTRCQPCQALQPTIERLTKEGYPVQQIDVEKQPEVAARFKVQHVPTCVLLVNGQVAGRLVGMRTHAELAQMFATATTQAAQQTAQQVAQQAQEYTVRGQSPEAPRRGLGLFNRLGAMGRQSPSDPGTPPMEIPVASAAPTADMGHEHAFAQRDASVPNMASAANAPNMPNMAGASGMSSIPNNALPANTHDFAAQPQAGFADPRAAAVESTMLRNQSVHEQALAATVRLKVEDASGHSFGTGTIIDVMKEEALIVTCGHIFRESKGQGRINVDVAGVSTPVQGQLISFDLTRDIALVSIRPGVKVAAMPIATDPQRAVEGARVFSVGCDNGREPTVRESRITAIDKYVGSPNYTVAGMPVEGRSGGGLFLANGQLIGICNAADQKDDEGLYAGLGTIHWQLDQINQSAIYKRNAQAVAQTMATEENVRPIDMEQASRMHNPNAAAPMRDLVPITETRQAPGAHDTEVICIVRSKSQPQHSSQVIVVEQPSVELMEMLQRSKQPQPQPNPNMMTNDQRQPTSFRQDDLRELPIVRGQSR